MRALLLLLVLSCAAAKPPPQPDPPPVAPPAPSVEADAGSCESDSGCALTYFREGNCCPQLCAPRVVSARRAAELKEQGAQCDRPCPKAACMPPRFETVPVCVQNKCVAKAVRAGAD